MSSDTNPVDDVRVDAADPQTDHPTETTAPADAPDVVSQPKSGESETSSAPQPRRLKIGSQRDEAARFAPKPVVTSAPPSPSSQPKSEDAAAPLQDAATESTATIEEVKSEEAAASEQAAPESDTLPANDKAASDKANIPPPRLTRTSPEIEQEIAEALGDASLEDLIAGEDTTNSGADVEPESRHSGCVVTIHKEDVFVDFGQRNQGVLSLKQLPERPEPGATLDVIVSRFDAEEGLYHLTLPDGAVDVGDWSDIEEGMVVEARVTGHNKGGLECEVNKIRAFIPASQIAPYRVEEFEQFVGEKFACLVTEAKQERRNLVLSRRAVLERQREEDRRELLGSLKPGDVREGVVRSLQNYGAFVDMGGVDGLLHVSQLSWERVSHPSDVLEIGQQIKVKIQKIDPDTGKISLAFRDLLESPWTDVARKYPVGSRAEGKVSKTMDFGAFVQLEPGVEGLVHVSELTHGRVWRPSDVVNEGDQVEVQVLSVDEQAQRIGLSMKAIQAKPVTQRKGRQESEEPGEAASKVSKRTAPLKGGIGGPAGGDQFGLKW